MKKFLKQQIMVLLFFTFFASPQPLYAVTNPISIMPSDQMAMVSPTPTPAPVDYQLAYPGILPDNPFYKLKALRDKIVGFLISDPLKKTDFDILQADKRYNAALYLFQQDQKKEMFITDTLSKADNYFSEALGQLDLAERQGEDIHDVLAKASLSNKKHIELLVTIGKTSSKSLQNSITLERKRTTEFTTQIEKKLTHFNKSK